MDSPQSVVSPLKRSSVFPEPEKQNTNLFVENAGCLSRGTVFERKETITSNPEDFLGILEVYIHQARDIHNICIYQKQDVYAKLCLTTDPENTVCTKIINGGGRNPIFNENLRLNVHKVYSSLKCEIWMLSRVRNYLEDQLLGFALVPLSEVLINNGKLEKEFSLSSTDLFHSPAGFVQLSLSYVGASPDVIPIPALPTSVATDAVVQDKESPASVSDDFEKIEFPDPKVANENHQMVSEYFGIKCANQDSDSSESLVTSDTENHISSDVGGQPVESFSTGPISSILFPKHDSPPSSVSTNGTSSASLPPSSESSETPGDSKSPNQEYVSFPKDDPKEKNADDGDAVSNASGGLSSNEFIKPLVTVNIEPEPKVVQQDIVDMYMKSMQQFTESLAKMKLPMDYESGPTSSGNSSSDQKSPASKTPSSRVFYGSRAFF
ncbi:Calcium-dependent lipid-binding (CaLB domain) family protein [Abeliophyllum distichum]|uniref:Calcium-dependent lipid-binding (CaLB domain) family protein n=1 Tax=Abeliophyllum distichum TaxID=126358 RepID=A0ABD1QII2_9LAMI